MIGKKGEGGTNHLVLQDAVFLVDFGTLCTMTPGHEVVELFFGDSLCPVVRAGEAEDAFWPRHDEKTWLEGRLLGVDSCLE